MTTPKSPEDVMREAEKYNVTSNLDAPPGWLRSSLASVLLHMAEQMPKKGELCGEEGCDYRHEGEPAFIRNKAIDGCKAILINEAKKITNV
jgi:hypothetical protein